MSRHTLHGEHSEELLTLADLQASVLVKQGALQRLHLEQASEFELLLAGKELEIKDCTERFGRLREDFNFNPSLIHERGFGEREDTLPIYCLQVKHVQLVIDISSPSI